MELPPPRANVGGKMDVRTGITLLPKWLRSTEVVHFLGKEEVGSSILPGASRIITMRYGWFYSVVE